MQWLAAASCVGAVDKQSQPAPHPPLHLIMVYTTHSKPTAIHLGCRSDSNILRVCICLMEKACFC